MAERNVDPRLQALQEAGKEVYSISRLNTINQCPYQAYLQYIRGANACSNIWGILGSSIHTALESCVKDGADESCIIEAMNEELELADTLGIDFPLDRNDNPSIRNNWMKYYK